MVMEALLWAQHFLSHVLAVFATANIIVNQNLHLKFASAVQSPEGRCFYSLQITIENHAHAETYYLWMSQR
jgi:ribonucleotide reductase beta subunit family protein with ferritin-like domain